MHDLIIGYAIIVMSVLSVLFAAAAVITAALQKGSLQADIRWVYRFIKIHMKHFRTNHCI